MKKSILILFIATFSSVLPLIAQSELPSIEVENLKGEKVDFSSYSKDGKITVISFWATWCTPCKKELNNMTELYPEWVEKYGVELVAVSIDDARNSSKVKSYTNGQNWEYTILLDKNGDLKRALNFQTVPFTLLIDKNGKIVEKHNGYVEGDEYELEDKIKELAH